MKRFAFATLLACASASAYAIPVNYTFSAAYRNDVQGVLAGPTFAPSATLVSNTSITGSFTYDSDAPIISSTPGVAVNYIGAITNLTASYGGYSITDLSGFASVFDALNGFALAADPDVPLVVSPAARNIAGFSVGGWSLANLRLFYTDDPSINGTQNYINGSALPATLPLAAYAPGESRVALDLLDSTGQQRHIIFFDNLTIANAGVPEPTTLALLGLGLLALIRKRRGLDAR